MKINIFVILINFSLGSVAEFRRRKRVSLASARDCDLSIGVVAIVSRPRRRKIVHTYRAIKCVTQLRETRARNRVTIISRPLRKLRASAAGKAKRGSHRPATGDNLARSFRRVRGTLYLYCKIHYIDNAIHTSARGIGTADWEVICRREHIFQRNTHYIISAKAWCNFQCKV